jgi:hypothetical protein
MQAWQMDREDHLDLAAAALADGKAVAHGYGNFYAITARPDASVVRMINLLKGRPPDQVGSVTTTPWRMAGLFDWSLMPAGLGQTRVFSLMESLLRLGPFGFRGPAAPGMPGHLSADDAGLRTTQVIYPGQHCPSNGFIAKSLQRTGADFLYTTSGNRSRHLTGAADEPVHYRGDALAAEFEGENRLVILKHADEAAAIASHPLHLPMSTTLLALHRMAPDDATGRPTLRVERQGSLALEYLAPLLAQQGFGLSVAPAAQQRLACRVY